MLKRCAAVLDPLTKASPGLLQGLYLMARVRYLSGIQNIVEINLLGRRCFTWKFVPSDSCKSCMPCFSGDIETAKTMLNHCLEKHDRFSEGHLLMAQVYSAGRYVYAY